MMNLGGTAKATRTGQSVLCEFPLWRSRLLRMSVDEWLLDCPFRPQHSAPGSEERRQQPCRAVAEADREAAGIHFRERDGAAVPALRLEP